MDGFYVQLKDIQRQARQIKKLVKEQKKDNKLRQHRQYIYLIKNPPKKEIVSIRKRACLLLSEQGYSAITMSIIFNLSEKTILRYLH